jgi:hypothetical protein
MGERERRIGRNEAAFREVNERIESLNRGIAAISDQTLQIVCECGDLGCGRQLRIDIPAYERVRADSACFIVIPGHDDPTVEQVVEETKGYHVVRKDPGGAREVAEETDPRRR